ncbi:hypothetical protein BABINDRAFT_159183 [Babjeviella inositovora NRRL Y-12698]|uniref:Pro-apoptotic serine protease NMA111 n=1 Tax=Babjeviella inositovora NRRL Y-12698 TaxID=984486 RepID=A0A1E3QYD7_9ASCO|nr:uncharacterized protein BABINDRAFT_159183 [Babjeviella inositovora NRRL Y-12698]ODQ82638.1 hypothetical protein BABINDRAFT_159183 [Babjeviella inositovora NRRL Y-12698]
MDGFPSTKRRLSSESDRVSKKVANGVLHDVAMTDVSNSVSISESESESGSEAEDVAFPADSPAWQATIQTVVKSVVSIHFAQVASFDLDSAVVSEATGFVVDAERGIILTNRHVVGAGPFWGYAVFDNHEEAVVKAIYRDPVHDFGFLKFNPADIKHMQVRALVLRPELAKVGAEIRVVGNDAGEKLSILAGFISRLDRNAPEYGHMTYNDFNTEYIQAAASASGGSSGSPVVNIDGYAVALQAGGSTESSTDFFLPVYRILRALTCVQTETPVTRGTIQVQWILKPFDECRRLGLTADAEAVSRAMFPEKIGLLVAEVVLPQGPADSQLKEGDVLISINGQNISTFIKVDDILDSSVGQTIDLVVQRGGVVTPATLRVGDLHAITPNRYLQVCGASFNDLSYQMARIYAIPVKGVFVNSASGSFFFDKNEKCGWIIDSVDDQDTPDLDTFIEVMKSIPDCKRVPVAFRHLTDLHSQNVAVIYIDRHWMTAFRVAVRNDESGLWDFTTMQEKPLPPLPLTPHNARFIDIAMESKGCAQLSRSFVLVGTKLPVPLDSFPSSRKRGYGVVIDAAKGYVLVSRYVVPHDLCDVDITIAESIIIPAKVIFLHPLHNYAVVKYDPALVLAPVQTPKFSSTPLRKGDKINFIGFNFNLRTITTETRISDISSINVPSSSMAPRYRGTNLEGLQIESNMSTHCSSGVLADNDGTIRAVWLSFLGDRNNDQDTIYRMGIDVTDINDIIQKFQNDETPNVRIIDSEFFALPLSQARLRGVSEKWIAKVEEQEGMERFQFLSVSRVACATSTQPQNPLLPGDIVLSVNGQAVHKIKDLNALSNNAELEFHIVRRKQEMTLAIQTVPTDTFNTSQVVIWCGAVLQGPHHGVRQLMKNLPSGVYCTDRAQGSPARHYGIGSTNFITHVNEQETPDLDAFMKVVKGIPDNTYVKLRIVSFDNVPFAISLKTNYHYFPTAELKKDTEQDKWVEHEE